MALPIVASPVGSIPEIIDRNGYLVCVLEPEESCYALRELMTNAALRERMGRRSRELATRYNVDDMVRGYEAALNDAILLGAKKSRSAFH